MSSSLGNYLRKKRREKEVTQKDLSNYIGISQSQLSKFENGEREITIRQFIKGCSYLRINITEIVRQLQN